VEKGETIKHNHRQIADGKILLNKTQGKKCKSRTKRRGGRAGSPEKRPGVPAQARGERRAARCKPPRMRSKHRGQKRKQVDLKRKKKKKEKPTLTGSPTS